MTDGMKVNLGCGRDIREGWTNVDVDESVGADVVHDLNGVPWPLDSNVATHVEARHVLEHLDDVGEAFGELARILKPGGTLEWVYPIGHTRFEDTTHQWFWNYNSGEFHAGERGEHTHEVANHWNLKAQSCTYHISHSEPLVWLYTKYREFVTGPGPWLEQIPGLAGEMKVIYEYNP